MDDKFRSGMARIETPLDLINRPISGAIFVIIVLVLLSHFGLFTDNGKQRHKQFYKN